MQINRYLNNDNVLNVYRFGSHVYGTENEQSDNDYIIVAKELFDPEDINIHVYTVQQFQSHLDEHDIQMLECQFLKVYGKHILQQRHKFYFELNLQKLRKSISTISSNSWVKGKKKLIVTGDYEPYLAIKSVFHSLRILDYGIQIAQHADIVNYSSMNFVLEDLKKLSKDHTRNDLWALIDTKYRSLYNSKSSAFKQLAPKDLTEKDMKSNLIRVLKSHGIENNTLADEILALVKL